MEYKFKPFPHSSHSKIIKTVEPNKSVLDIGCSSGYLAYNLKLKNCKVIGIEKDKNSAEKAKMHCEEVFNIDISKEKIKGRYDIIILGDILEHLPEPGKVLLNLKENLNNNGYILVSVPNIANIYPRLKILLGNFDYEEKGIFDRTHLRFFTKKSFKRLIRNTRYKIEKLEYTPIPVYLKFPRVPKFLLTPIYYLFYALAVCWPSMFAYQFLAKIR